MAEKDHDLVYRLENGLARFAPGAVILIALFFIFSAILYGLIHTGASEGTIQRIAGVTSIIGIFAVLGSFVLLALSIMWVVDSE